jgi:hypothetical protein
MRSRAQRLLMAGMVVGMIWTTVGAAPALGVMRYVTTYYDAGGRPFLSIGLYGGYASFGATYDAFKTQDAGQTWWVVNKFETSAVAQGGRNCENSGYCIGWAFASKVQFLNAAGGVVATFYPPPGSCYGSIISSADKLITKCKATGYQVSASATKIKFTFTLTVVRRDGAWFSWPTVTKTILI